MRVSLKILWGIAVLYTALIGVDVLWSKAIPPSVPVLLLLAFVLFHGAMRYRWSGILVFIVIALVVSNVLENASILTGFPFGHYHYTNALGPKLFLVPVAIGLAYIGTGYLAWVIATVLVSEVRRGSSAFTTVAVPVVASFVMVVWDLCFDPAFSTVLHWWIWEQGGGYFGVPLTNYLGWFLTVYLFYQGFALYLRWHRADRVERPALPRAYFFQAVALYAVQGLTFVLQYLSARHTQVTDATGHVWQTGDIYETAAIVSIYTMLFVAVMTTVKLMQENAQWTRDQGDRQRAGSAEEAAAPAAPAR